MLDKNSIFRLGMHIFSLEMYIFSLKMYISNLEMKFVFHFGSFK